MATSALGEDFRVENRVFVEGANEPISESKTLFRGGVAYDYLDNPEEVTVFDVGHQRIILLDPVHRLRTELNTADIETFNQQMRRVAPRRKDGLLRFLIDPTFDEKFDSVSGELRLKSPYLTYRLTTTAIKNDRAASEYLTFSDWSARLAPLLNPQARPPFARLAVNNALRERGRVPLEVHLTITHEGALATRKQTLRSEHRIQWRLRAADLRRVEETGRWLVTFEAVDPVQYVQAGQEQARR